MPRHSLFLLMSRQSLVTHQPLTLVNLALSCSSSQVGDRSSWVVDSGASDHMTFDDRDFVEKTPPQCMCVANANGVLSSVTGAGTVNLSLTLSLTHCLLLSSLSHKLLSVSQVTTALNCVVLMYSMFCLL
jgi:hypothetical protein